MGSLYFYSAELNPAKTHGDNPQTIYLLLCWNA